MFVAGFIQKKKRSRPDETQCRSARVSTESLVSKSNLSFSSMDEDISGENTTDDELQAPKRLALQDSNLPRYEQEFLELSLIGMCVCACADDDRANQIGIFHQIYFFH